MKRSPRRSRLSKLSSFTLVELLVVIAIIAILASVILYAGTTVLKMAKRTKATNMATQIQTAALGYYTEYGVYPVPSGTNTDYVVTDVTASKGAWGALMCSLCGNVSPYYGTNAPAGSLTPTNSRSIAFLSGLKTSDVDSNNAPLNPLPISTNIYFNIAIDSDYDGILGTTTPTSGVLPNFTLSTTSAMNYTGTSTAGVAVWENCNGSTSSTNPNFWVHVGF